MDKIVIGFQTENIKDLPNFETYINDVPVPFTMDHEKIVIDNAIQPGLNLLKIRLNNLPIGSKIILTEFYLNGVSSRQTLYLTFEKTANGAPICSTWLTDLHPELIIPFGNPMSWWLCECNKKIPNTLYGTNLYDNLDIFYPESIDIDTAFPQVMKDFMKFNFGFHVYKKSSDLLHNKQLPWIKINLDYDEEELFTEFIQNRAILGENYYKPKQNQYNLRDSKNLKEWHVAMVLNSPTEKPDILQAYTKEELPVFFKLLDQITSLDIKILHAFIGIVEPNAYVAPHTDDFYKYRDLYKDTSGCSQIYIPIGWEENNYFMFNEVGFLPFNSGPFIVNNSDFVHGSINASSSTRFTIGIYCQFTEENIKSIIA